MTNFISASAATGKQQCALTNLYRNLFIFATLYAGGSAFLVYRGNWQTLLLWLVALPFARWVSLRLSPLTSKWRGSGSVADKLPSHVNEARVEVTLYSHNGCPFCPIVKCRLEALQKEMGFTLAKINLSIKPQLAESMRIKSVPVVEVGANRLVGNATSEQIGAIDCRGAAIRALFSGLEPYEESASRSSR
ncbi:MAG TPA: glutaredoxin family protein [Terriglobia bacterium]|nr:glutaredoxin family protein [Terriglobia bacterium]